MKTTFRLILMITFLFIIFSVHAQFQTQELGIKDLNEPLNIDYVIGEDLSNGLKLQEELDYNNFLSETKFGVYGGIISIFPSDARIKASLLVEYFISNSISIQYARWFTEDMSLGTIGFSFLLNLQNESKIKPYVGLLAGSYGDDDFIFEIPVGISYTDLDGLSFRLGVKTAFYPEFGGSALLGELLLGYKF